MKSEKFFAAIGEIDVSYIGEVVNYNAELVAACVAVAVLAIGIIPLLKSDNQGSQGFVLVAYASENNVVMENELQEGKNVPISFFKTENGLKGFVFAYSKNNPGDMGTISVYNEGGYRGEKIIGLNLDNDKNYILYIPEEGKDFPYSLRIPYTDEAANKVIFRHLLLEETEDGYMATCLASIMPAELDDVVGERLKISTSVQKID